jgi:hypothetical protein
MSKCRHGVSRGTRCWVAGSFVDHRLAYAPENTVVGQPASDWKAACFCDKDRRQDMQGIQPYTGIEQRVDVRACDKETREMVDFLARSLPSLCRNACRHQAGATSSNDVVERALLSAYRHLGHSKGPVQMSTWLTAIALLIAGPDRAEAPVPAVSTKTPTQN